VVDFRYLGTLLIIENYIHEEAESKLISEYGL